MDHPALHAFDDLHRHLRAAADTCGEAVAWEATSPNTPPTHEVGEPLEPKVYTPTSAHTRLAWEAAWAGADAAGRRLWAALDAHPALSPLLHDTRPRLSLQLPWTRGARLRVSTNPTGTTAALHLGSLAPMPALGLDIGCLGLVRAGLRAALATPHGPGRTLLFVQDPVAHPSDLPMIGIALGPVVDRGAAGHLLEGCRTERAPAWVLCRLAQRSDTGGGTTPAGSPRDGQGLEKAAGGGTGTGRYLTILGNGNPLWFAARNDADAHKMLDEPARGKKRHIVWTPIA